MKIQKKVKLGRKIDFYNRGTTLYYFENRRTKVHLSLFLKKIIGFSSWFRNVSLSLWHLVLKIYRFFILVLKIRNTRIEGIEAENLLPPLHFAPLLSLCAHSFTT
jgi:hypothetical protein